MDQSECNRKARVSWALGRARIAHLIGCSCERSPATRCAASETERSLAERSGGTARADQATSALAMEWAGKPEGSLLRQQSDWLNEENRSLPLQQMNTEERLVADYSGTSLTVGQHPMYYRRRELRLQGILSAQDLRGVPQRGVRSGGGLRDRATTARYSQRFHLHLDGRRNRNSQCDCYA